MKVKVTKGNGWYRGLEDAVFPVKVQVGSRFYVDDPNTMSARFIRAEDCEIVNDVGEFVGIHVMRDDYGVERRYREIRRKAKVGDLVRVFGHPLNEANGVFTVDQIEDDGHIYYGEKYGRLPDGYVVLEPLESDNQPHYAEPDPLELIAKLSLEVAELKRKFSIFAENTLERGKELEQALAKIPKPLTRDEIVEQAKRDVEYFTKYIADKGIGRIEFIVNREKRTVVALWKSRFGHVFSRAIAKCAPQDCFNSHIGRAIAVRRLLSERVPDEYLNAPQPTEARVGDVVDWQDGSIFEVTAIKGSLYSFRLLNSWRGFKPGETAGEVPYVEGISPYCRVIDDSREPETEASR